MSLSDLFRQSIWRIDYTANRENTKMQPGRLAVTKFCLYTALAFALASCQAKPLPAEDAASTTLCDGTVYRLTGKLSPAEIEAFSGYWAGKAVSSAGSMKGCVTEEIKRQQTVTKTGLKLVSSSPPSTCSNRKYEFSGNISFANLRGQGFYADRKSDGGQIATWIEGDTLRQVTSMTGRGNCWSGTFRRVQ